MTYHAILFTDLDDTLFVSPRKHPHPDDPGDLLALKSDGSAHAHATRASRWLLTLLARDEHTLVVPVTGRTAQALARVQLTWRGPKIVDHGLRVLDASGHDDGGWRASTEAALASREAALHAASLATKPLVSPAGLRTHTIRVHDRDAYLVFKHPDRTPGVFDDLRPTLQAVAATHDLHAFWTDSTFTLFPRGLGKRAAVTYLRTQLDPAGTATTIGVGDAASDVPFMDACDLAVTPTTSQLFDVLRFEAARHGGAS